MFAPTCARLRHRCASLFLASGIKLAFDRLELPRNLKVGSYTSRYARNASRVFPSSSHAYARSEKLKINRASEKNASVPLRGVGIRIDRAESLIEVRRRATGGTFSLFPHFSQFPRFVPPDAVSARKRAVSSGSARIKLLYKNVKEFAAERRTVFAGSEGDGGWSGLRATAGTEVRVQRMWARFARRGEPGNSKCDWELHCF